MAVEIPIFRRCCFCVPLRYGLLVWGYLKLALGLLSLLYLIFLAILILTWARYPDAITIIIMIAVALLEVTSFIMTTLFIVAAHTKNHKLLNAYYRYGLVSTTIYFISYCIIIGMMIYSALRYINVAYMHSLDYIALNLSLAFLYIVLQIYLLLLLRSEIIKLNNNHEFQFTNLAAEAEAQCVMTTPHPTEFKTTPQSVENEVHS